MRRGIVPEPDTSLVVDAAAAGDRRADRLLRERARAVGRAVALLLDVLNPDLVVVTEQASVIEPDYLEEIRGPRSTSRTSAETPNASSVHMPDRPRCPSRRARFC